MPRFGSDRQYVSNNLSSNTDAGGNAIISPDNGFGGSPLGPAAIAQSLYAIANPLFNLTPPDVLSAIAPDNQVPYWQFSNFSNSMSGSMFFDSTAQTWAVRLNPGTAAAGEYITLKTRSYLINDTNLNLRQKALATVTKVGTYSSTNQWNLVLTASYYDVTGAQLHSYAIGTVADNGTWSSITGNTTSGGTAVNAAAAYVDLDFTLTAAATVSGTAKVDIESLLLATSTTATGAFLVTQTFNASGTFTRPTGVNYVSVVGIASGAGGGGGGISINSSSASFSGGPSGGAGNWAIVRDIYVGDVSTVSVGIGAAGTGGAGTTAIKTSGGGGSNPGGGNGGDAATTTFGSYLTIPGGRAGGQATAASSLVYGMASLGGTWYINAGAGSAHDIAAYTKGAPFTTLIATAASGTGFAASSSGGSALNGTGGAVSVAVGLGPMSGQGGSAFAGTTAGTAGLGTLYNGYAGGPGGGAGGGGAVQARFTGLSQTILGTAGAGGSATANSGAGGAGGGAVAISATPTTNFNTGACTVTSGSGAAGAAGFVTVVWTA